MRAPFCENICENERIGSRRGRAPTDFVCRSTNAIKNSSEFCSTRDGACLRQVTVIVLPAKIEQPHNFSKILSCFFLVFAGK